MGPAITDIRSDQLGSSITKLYCFISLQSSSMCEQQWGKAQ